jgi:hypothetical protein
VTGIHDQPTTASKELIAGLERLGYRGPLLERNYTFPDWFAGQQPRTLYAAAFCQTPVSYESACIGVAEANGLRELALANSFRAFGAPVLLEVDGDSVREWAISASEDRHALVGNYRASEIQSVVASRAQDWAPEYFLRAKNIGSFRWTKQLSLFAGLIPDLEKQIQAKLDPLLRDALSRTREAYVESTHRPPNARDLFQLVFWVLTAKVFRDRRVSGFVSLAADPDAILAAVARQYKTNPPRPLNREARQAAASSIWQELDFRNLSVEVLAHIWSRTLVDRDTRKRLGIHRTPRAIVRYIIDQIPFSPLGDDDRIVFEPCSGSAAFLIGALNHLRPNLLLASSQERHNYFVRHLAGIEYDPFGVEISKLALTLADFPNPNSWNVKHADIFAPNAMTEFLKRADIVLCNPPFESFNDEERNRYNPVEMKKPAELLRRVLKDLHPGGVLGFVLPYNAVDGRPYATTRKLLAERFASLELTVLPERSFEDAETDIAVLIAKEPIPHSSSRVALRRVQDSEAAWGQFEREQAVSSDYSENLSSEGAKKGFLLADLPQVWNFMADHDTLGAVAEIHRGIEWRNRITVGLHIRSEHANGYARGVAPSTKFAAFRVPTLRYLNINDSEQRRNSWRNYDWSKPKAIVPKARVSRGHWRMVAFPDREGIVCHHTFYGVWPKSEKYDEVVLAAILNSPVANAFVATREGNRDITREVLRLIPVPAFSTRQRERLHSLVARYQASIATMPLDMPENAERLLLAIDAVVLDAYHMPPRLERQLLDYFNDHDRKVAHEFRNYYPATFDVFVSLSQYLDPRFATATAGELVRIIGAS